MSHRPAATVCSSPPGAPFETTAPSTALTIQRARALGLANFSVFSNLADVNKRVLYARDEQGRVAGRCLRALTAGGE